MSVIFRAYELSDYGGALKTYWSPVGYRYLKIPKAPFQHAGLGLPKELQAMGSYKLNMLVTAEPSLATVLLFQRPSELLDATPFYGDFHAYGATWYGDAGSGYAMPKLPPRTGSLLVVHHSIHDYLPIRLKEHFKQRATDLVDQAINDLKKQRGDFADRRGEIVISWDPFPVEAPDQVFIAITVPLTAKLPVASDLECAISYDITLDIDSDGRLGAYVQIVRTWVEGGLFNGSVSWRLRAAALQAVDTLNAELAGGWRISTTTTAGRTGISCQAPSRLDLCLGIRRITRGTPRTTSPWR
jgi:hypothetical protein